MKLHFVDTINLVEAHGAIGRAQREGFKFTPYFLTQLHKVLKRIAHRGWDGWLFGDFLCMKSTEEEERSEPSEI